MKLRDATTSEIEGVLEQTHALWSDGLDPASYLDYIRTLMASEWAGQGERNYRFLVLVDDAGEQWVAGLKLYRFTARLDDELIPVGGIGAVFTPPAQRRSGYAAAMIGKTHDLMARRGDQISLLFSEIGAEYYARLGYRGLDPGATRIQVASSSAGGAGAPIGLKRMHRNDLDDVIRLREREDAGAGFALVRDRALWKYMLARASYPTLHLGRERWESRLMTDPGRGYLWSMFGDSHEGASAKLLEFGEAEPGCSLPGLLDDFFAECRRRGVAEFDAWLTPSHAARDPRLAGHSATRLTPPPVVPMWRPIDRVAGADLERHAASALFHLTDVF